MKILVISDIHANLVAFRKVLEDSQGEWECIWCLGDIVGYGPDPDECIDTLRQFDHLSLSGNHDWAVLGRLDIQSFNDDAQMTIRWTQKAISKSNMEFLDSLPSLFMEKPYTLAHASPRQPVWEYVLDPHTAAKNFGVIETRHCLIGHSHVPMVYEQAEDGSVEWFGPIYGIEMDLKMGRFMINPGSVGQPRDYDARAAYGILDLEEQTWEFRRVEYSIEETQKRMEELGLPHRLIARLSLGA